jgi:uncharacterized membrane protein YtjA (UPF0391 family)
MTTFTDAFTGMAGTAATLTEIVAVFFIVVGALLNYFLGRDIADLGESAA